METRAEIPTSEGVFVAIFSSRGLRQLQFPGTEAAVSADQEETNPLNHQQQVWLDQTREALHAVLRADVPTALPPFDWSGHTEFRQRVWRAMLQIPTGQTGSYGEIARALGQSFASRAVGGACGANPIPVLVPCHRVLSAGGRIGGFSGGLDWKRRLLRIEGIKEKAPGNSPALL